MTAAVVPSLLQAAPVGTYMCSVDHCRKQYLMKGEQLLDACRAGVENAVKSGPASTACLQMCDETYAGNDTPLNKACTEGCSLFPSACLRDGKFPPKEHRTTTENRPRPNW
jgi:hypothetical protein